jgi:hypothetical protein
MNRYVYVGDDPVNFVDPTGRGVSSLEGLGIGLTAVGVAAGIVALAATAPVTATVAGAIGVATGAVGLGLTIGCAVIEPGCG